MWARASALSRGLAARLEPSDARIVVGVMTRNRPEWIATDLAILERGYVSVALAPDDSDDRLAQIFALTKPTCVVVEAHNAERVTRLATTAKLVVVLDGAANGETPDRVRRARIRRSDPGACSAPRRRRSYAVLITSGSTGMPKGAMRTYRTFHAMIASYAIGHSPRHLSFQPLSHLSASACTCRRCCVNGGCIAFSRGGAHLVEELAHARAHHASARCRACTRCFTQHRRRVRCVADARDPRGAPSRASSPTTRAASGRACSRSPSAARRERRGARVPAPLLRRRLGLRRLRHHGARHDRRRWQDREGRRT